jgi:WD40 repeat protein/transcriptional regulator with XRE-family HTH domain
MSHSRYPELDYRFGLQILALRTEGNLTQSGLAGLLGVSRQAVVGWESGAYYPSPQHLRHLIELGLQYHAFHRGQEAEEIRALWESAHPRLPLDETWLTHLLEQLPDSPAAPHSPQVGAEPLEPGPHVDWGDAPEVSSYHGRQSELALLAGWLLEQRCRLVSLLGMGGIGKTSLAAKLVQEAAPRFERVYWRSLRDAPSPIEWLGGAIGFLSDQQVVPPMGDMERLAVLLQLLRARRCLLVLDNFETVFEPGQEEGRYRAGLAGYGRLLRSIGEAKHQSCLLLTSREAPAELAVLGGEAVRNFPLGGLGVDEARLVLAPKQLLGSSEQWAELVIRFGGNALALKLVGERIRELFDRNIGLFLEEADDSSVFGGIRQLLAEQVGRSSAPEQQLLRALAVARERMRLASMLAALGPRLGRGTVMEAVEALRRRSLLERVEVAGRAAFTLQSVVLEYVTDRLVEAVVEEIASGQPALLVEQALIQAQARDYVRQTQEWLIGAPILEQLKASQGQAGTERQLLALLNGWRGRPELEQGYGPGNLVNLLRLLRGDLRGLDLSRLVLRHAYLAEVDAQDASLAGAHLAETVLAEAFGFPSTVALSGDGGLLAAGTSTGEVWLWRVADRTLVETLEGHTGGVWGVALSADGHLLASGGGDGTVRLWETSTGRVLTTVRGHTGLVWGVALSADGYLLASGGTDGMVRLWDAPSGQLIATLEGHTGVVWGIALSADGRLAASGSADGTMRLWETSSGRLLATLQGHTSIVRSLTLSADGQLLVSGSVDGTIELWETSTGWQLANLEGHTGAIWALALSAEGQLLASSGADGTVRLWEASTGRPLAALQGHTGVIRGIALSAEGQLLASGGTDGTVRLWETKTGRLLATIPGYTGVVWGVALSADGQLLASSSGDGMVRLWETSTGRQLAALEGHAGPVWGVALSADGHLLASGGGDGTVCLWETKTSRLLATLEGYAAPVWSVALSADGQLLASSSEDGMVRLWETRTGRLLATLEGHTAPVWSVALSAPGKQLASGSGDAMVRLWDAPSGQPMTMLEGHTCGVWGVALSAEGQLLASGSEDGKMRLWETSTGRQLAALEGHTAPVWSVALSADGHLLASGGGDGKVRLWEAQSGQLIATLEGHAGVVWSIALSADGLLLASGGFGGTVRLWDARSGAPLRALRAARRYECMDITRLTGITNAQRQALLMLGAVEDEAGAGSGQVAQG